MANEKENSGTFKGLNISAIEQGLSLVLPDLGGSQGNEGEKDTGSNAGKKGLDLNTGGNIISQKIEVPETPEEIAKAAGKNKESSESHEGEDIQDKGGEDAIIKEDSPLYLHAATLHEEGILPTLDLEKLKGKKFDEAMQIFLSAQKEYIEQGKNEYLNSLTDRQKEFLEMIELGISQENVEHQFTIEDAYSKVTDEALADNEDLQKQIISQDLKLKGLSDTKVQNLIKSAEDNDRLFEESKESRDNINNYIKEQKQLQIDEAKEQQKRLDDQELELQKQIKTAIEKTDEILPGIKITANEKTKLEQLMTKPVEEKVINGRKTPINMINKKRMEDRVLFDLKLNYYIQLGLFDSNADLSKFVKKVTSTAAEKLSTKLKEEPAGISGKGITYEKKKDEGNKSKIIFPSLM